MKKAFYLLGAVFFCVTLQSQAAVDQNTAKPTTFSPDQVKQIQQIVHEYIVKNPSVLMEAGKTLQEQEAAKEKAKLETIKNNISKYKNEIFDTKAPGRIVTGNPNGKIIIAEFTQYQCPHCLSIKPLIAKLLKDNPDVQLITIYWPFFGNDAIYAAKVALAAQKQNKFNEFNQAMIAAREFMNQEKTDNVIKSIPGLDAKKLHTDMDAKELDAGLKANFKLAQNLGIIGTPVFMFTNKEMTKFSFIPGQTPNIEEDLKQSLNTVR
ncbi:MAG: outer membrane protein [uncultured bacterium]|nr:MAG: outer membrane protein [uncultured bacterium]